MYSNIYAMNKMFRYKVKLLVVIFYCYYTVITWCVMWSTIVSCDLSTTMSCDVLTSWAKHDSFETWYGTRSTSIVWLYCKLVLVIFLVDGVIEVCIVICCCLVYRIIHIHFDDINYVPVNLWVFRSLE